MTIRTGLLHEVQLQTWPARNAEMTAESDGLGTIALHYYCTCRTFSVLTWSIVAYSDFSLTENFFLPVPVVSGTTTEYWTAVTLLGLASAATTSLLCTRERERERESPIIIGSSHEISANGSVTIKDIPLLCSNCHTLLHNDVLF